MNSGIGSFISNRLIMSLHSVDLILAALGWAEEIWSRNKKKSFAASMLIAFAQKCYYVVQGGCAKRISNSMVKQDSSQLSSGGSGGYLKRTAKISLAIILLIGTCVASYQVLKEIFPTGQIFRFPVSDWISLKGQNERDTISADRTENGQEIRIAVAPIVSPEKSMEMYQPFINYIGKKLARKATALYRETYSETNDLVRYQRCDIAIVCTYPFIRGEKEFGMQALVVPQINGVTTYQSIILVPVASSAKTLFDLRGKRFASADIISTTGWLFPAMLLMDAGENPNKFFGELVITGSHDRSLQAVIDGFVDGAAVHGIVYDQMVLEDPSTLGKVKVLAKSAPFGIPPIVAHPDLDPQLKKDIVSVLMKMHEDAEGISILAKLHIERFVLPDANLFAPLRLAISKLEKWR
jgi:phosphonate transport system substrate-binding protein